MDPDTGLCVVMKPLWPYKHVIEMYFLEGVLIWYSWKAEESLSKFYKKSQEEHSTGMYGSYDNKVFVPWNMVK